MIFFLLLQLTILMVRATNIKAQRAPATGSYNSILLARDGVSCHSAQPVQKLAATPEMLNGAFARVSFCAAKIVRCNNKKKSWSTFKITSIALL
jgi:hypothetical protein